MTNKIKIRGPDGKNAGEMELPEFFSEKIREDIVSKVLEAERGQQPYGPSRVAGKQHSASGRIVHRRHVWRSGYGRGMSRVPRKILSRRGSQFNWVGAEVASTRGGRRAHPPKPWAMTNTKKINKKEFQIALASALSATASKEHIAKRYSQISEKDIKDIPFVVGSDFASLKTKKLIDELKNILGKDLFETLSIKKKIRAGKGKRRGRRYKSNAGLLIVRGSREKINAGIFDAQNVRNLGIKDIASGGLGRIVIYTEEAIRELKERFGGNKKK